MIPPSGIVLVYLLGATTLIMGMLLAWAWGVITMKAAYAARPSAETQARLASLQQAAGAQANATGTTPAAAAQVMIYEGYMLDARVTVVVYCMTCFFIYLLVSEPISDNDKIVWSLFRSDTDQSRPGYGQATQKPRSPLSLGQLFLLLY